MKKFRWAGSGFFHGSKRMSWINFFVTQSKNATSQGKSKGTKKFFDSHGDGNPYAASSTNPVPNHQTSLTSTTPIKCANLFSASTVTTTFSTVSTSKSPKLNYNLKDHDPSTRVIFNNRSPLYDQNHTTTLNDFIYSQNLPLVTLS